MAGINRGIPPHMVVHVGTSGWSYDHWSGVLYESGLPTAKRLSAYAAEFDTVELNASFYRWPKDATFAQWRERLPEGFRMSVKAARGSDARATAALSRAVDQPDRRRPARARGPAGGVAWCSCIPHSNATMPEWTTSSVDYRPG